MKAQLLFLAFLFPVFLFAQTSNDFPVRGLCVGAPGAEDLDRFIGFIDEELSARGINTLILRVDYGYAYESHPELREEETLSKSDIKSLVNVCNKHNINLIPQINLLGHQSWHSTPSNLIKVYPQFDETPHVKLPEKYVWPNEDGLYCKSYCPLHPDVHSIVFELVDEICDVFEASDFHAGMDEVFYLADEKCPRCAGRDQAKLFADEVVKIQNHLQQKNRRLWIWGDRLIDGRTTGIGMWEGSYNNTARAIDMIPTDVMICDWHYERPDPTAVIFASKGFDVLTCPWRNPKVAAAQVEDMHRFRQNATTDMEERYQGMLQTVWSSAEAFMDQYYGESENKREDGLSQVECFRTVFPKISESDNR